MTSSELRDYLRKYDVDPNQRKAIFEEIRKPIEHAIRSHFKDRPSFRYGGSIAKGTANSNGSDADLLVYFDSSCVLTLKEIYEGVLVALRADGFWCEAKNSAICIFGSGTDAFDISIDVVPGKFTSDPSNADVYLYCNRGNQKFLKSNPEKQIGKVLDSSMKQVIRLIKVYRQNSNFKFKSFFLEIFAIDVVEPKLEEGCSLFEKLVCFCKCFREIGKTKIYDPANSNNNIMEIHSEDDFQIIRNKIQILYECLLTNDALLIEKCFEGAAISSALISESYKRAAEKHASGKLRTDISLGEFKLYCSSNGREIITGQALDKYVELTFVVSLGVQLKHKYVYLVVANAGYESDIANQPRGESTRMEYSKNGVNYQVEHTSYNGEHFVQAYYLDNGKKHYSNCFVVRIKDYE